VTDPRKNEYATDAATTPSISDSGASTEEKAKLTENLSPEEQMALYEKELKENDWGHQPC
jgi:hypothetical protein